MDATFKSEYGEPLLNGEHIELGRIPCAGEIVKFTDTVNYKVVNVVTEIRVRKPHYTIILKVMTTNL